jgi:hypothetical protein
VANYTHRIGCETGWVFQNPITLTVIDGDESFDTNVALDQYLSTESPSDLVIGNMKSSPTEL